MWDFAGNIGKAWHCKWPEEKHALLCNRIEFIPAWIPRSNFRADIAVLMNITPTILDRYDHCMQNFI